MPTSLRMGKSTARSCRRTKAAARGFSVKWPWPASSGSAHCCQALAWRQTRHSDGAHQLPQALDSSSSVIWIIKETLASLPGIEIRLLTTNFERYIYTTQTFRRTPRLPLLLRLGLAINYWGLATSCSALAASCWLFLLRGGRRHCDGKHFECKAWRWALEQTRATTRATLF